MSQPIKLLDEDLDVLIQIFRYLEFSPHRNGTVRLAAEGIPNEIAAPFFRALMRREARLLREDADEMSGGLIESRTHAQRRADAFVDLVLSIDAASRYFPGDRDYHN
jgi:hypothetical protein